MKIRCKRGSKARSIGGGFKLFHHGLDGKRNGAGVILKEEYLNSFVEVKSVSQNHEFEAKMLSCCMPTNWMPGRSKSGIVW